MTLEEKGSTLGAQTAVIFGCYNFFERNHYLEITSFSDAHSIPDQSFVMPTLRKCAL